MALAKQLLRKRLYVPSHSAWVRVRVRRDEPYAHRSILAQLPYARLLIK
jgi:hypothetical protein